MHAGAPLPAYVPAAQSTHRATVSAPAAPLAFPAGQGRQEANVWPATGLYVPAGHCVQFAGDVPWGRLLYEPAGQGVHDAARGESAYVPMGQGAHSVLPLAAAKLPLVQLAQACSTLTPPSLTP